MREAFGYASLEWKRGIDWDAVRAFRLARAREAMQLPEGEARQNALRNAAQLRVYASMKRALAPQTAKSE